MLKSRKALSEVVSTVIIAGSLLIMAAIASWLATSMFEVQSQQAELERAKEAFTNLAEAIEEVAAKPGASAYVRFSPRAGGVEIQQNYAKLTLKISTTSSPTFSRTYTVGAIRYRGGPYASVSSKVVIKGDDWNDFLIVKGNNGAPVVWVYTDPDKGKYIYLDTARVRVTELGEISTTDGEYKVVELLFINLRYGEAKAGPVVDTKVSCISKNVEVLLFNGSTLTVEVEVGTDRKPQELKANGCEGFVVYIVESTVQVDFL